MSFGDKTTEEVLLERHARSGRAAPQRGVNILRYVFHLDAWHHPTVAPNWRHGLHVGAPLETRSPPRSGLRRQVRRRRLSERLCESNISNSTTQGSPRSTSSLTASHVPMPGLIRSARLPPDNRASSQMRQRTRLGRPPQHGRAKRRRWASASWPHARSAQPIRRRTLRLRPSRNRESTKCPCQWGCRRVSARSARRSVPPGASR